MTRRHDDTTRLVLATVALAVASTGCDAPEDAGEASSHVARSDSDSPFCDELFEATVQIEVGDSGKVLGAGSGSSVVVTTPGAGADGASWTVDCSDDDDVTFFNRRYGALLTAQGDGAPVILQGSSMSHHHVWETIESGELWELRSQYCGAGFLNVQGSSVRTELVPIDWSLAQFRIREIESE